MGLEEYMEEVSRKKLDADVEAHMQAIMKEVEAMEDEGKKGEEDVDEVGEAEKEKTEDKEEDPGSEDGLTSSDSEEEIANEKASEKSSSESSEAEEAEESEEEDEDEEASMSEAGEVDDMIDATERIEAEKKKERAAGIQKAVKQQHEVKTGFEEANSNLVRFTPGLPESLPQVLKAH